MSHSETKIKRHSKVRGEKSPYDGDWIYWTARIGKHPEVSTRMATLLKNQKGKCNHCEHNFKDGDLLEIDHKIPKSKGGKDLYNNLQVLHRHCHDIKTTRDGSLKRLVSMKRSLLSEKPCEGKLSSTVLKTSVGGDSYA